MSRGINYIHDYEHAVKLYNYVNTSTGTCSSSCNSNNHCSYCNTALWYIQGHRAQGRDPWPDKQPPEQQQWRQHSGRRQSFLAFWLHWWLQLQHSSYSIDKTWIHALMKDMCHYYILYQYKHRIMKNFGAKKDISLMQSALSCPHSRHQDNVGATMWYHTQTLNSTCDSKGLVYTPD